MKNSVMVLAFLCLTLLGSIPAAAQYNEIYRRGASLYCDDTKLTQDQIALMLEDVEGVTYSDYLKYSKGYNTGKGLLIGFGSLTGAGLVTTGVGLIGLVAESIALGVTVALTGLVYAATGEEQQVEFKSKFSGVAITGLCATGIGVLGMAAGTSVFCVYKKKMNTLVDACNAVPTSDVTLTWGPQRHGFGLALNF